MKRRALLRLIAGSVAATACTGRVAAAPTADTLLDAAEAFRLVARLERDTIVLRWRIADGYYLYRDRVRVSVDPATAAVGPVQLPAGTRKHDEIFGDVEVWRGEVSARVPLAPVKRGTPRRVALRVTSQGCADLGVCYTPNEARLELSSDAPETSPAIAPARPASLLDALGDRPASPPRKLP